MPIFVPDIVSERGKADAKRHRDKHREAIKKNLPEIIADESIITGKKGKIIKIPIKSIDIPYFRSGKGVKGVGVGQGKGKRGDVLGRRPREGKAGAPGTEPGEDYIETEVQIEELIEMMFEDLGLPNLEDKATKELIVEMGYRIHGHTKTGPPPLLDRRATAKEGMRHFWILLRMLEQETGKDELTCFDALEEAQGGMEGALKLLSDPLFRPHSSEVKPFPILGIDDLRFRKIEADIRKISQAVVFAMMDVSGSMTTMKKYLARSLLFWLTAFLRKLYEHVEIRFIIHHTVAKFVDEESFFKTGESGGTYCSSAYELANQAIADEYPTSQWNVYVTHFSDGEDFDTARTIEEIKKLFSKDVNMVGYGEIRPLEESFGGRVTSELFHAIEESFKVSGNTREDIRVITGVNEPLVGVVIEKREHILPALKEFLKKDRWGKEGVS